MTPSKREPADSAPATSSDHLPSPAAATAIDIIVLLAARNEPVQLRSLAEAVGAARSTVHRIAQTLEIKQIVRRVDGGYVLAAGAERLRGVLPPARLADMATHVLEELHASLGETTNFAVPHERAMLIVAAVQSRQQLRTVTPIGTHDPLHASALGKAYLAALPLEEEEELLSAIDLQVFTPRTRTSLADLRKDIDAARRRGFAIDNQERATGVRCIAAAVVSGTSAPVGALSVSAPIGRLTLTRAEELGVTIAQSAGNLARLIEEASTGRMPATTPGPRAS